MVGHHDSVARSDFPHEHSIDGTCPFLADHSPLLWWGGTGRRYGLTEIEDHIGHNNIEKLC